MELLFKDDKKQIYVEDGNLYTLTNMGSFVESEKRVWPKPDYWILTEYKEKDRENSKGITINALIDNFGNYIKIALQKDKIRRVIKISDNFVTSDIIYDKRLNNFTGEEYVGIKLDKDFQNAKLLSEYLEEIKDYRNKKGISIRIANPGNKKIKHFLKMDEELRQLMKTKTKTR